MRETRADVEALQRLLDESHAHGGAHLQSIFTPDRRLDAVALCELMVGVQILNLATVTASGQPRVGPVDGVFYRARFYFGSAPHSVRMRHIRARPAVSAAHTRGEELAVIVHGSAHPIDLAAADERGFRDTLLATYVPRYGPEWEQWVENNAVYARIEPERLYTFWNPPGPS
ncbi:MAG TPA: pyridoxamine 5'-phosphate oxidase family protein [Acidimicrobiia bacterium]|nr:pyridoxamine 5'-phosphate oxidase family protein [Acidimicrobiia bacterium]